MQIVALIERNYCCDCGTLVLYRPVEIALCQKDVGLGRKRLDILAGANDLELVVGVLKNVIS